MQKTINQTNQNNGVSSYERARDSLLLSSLDLTFYIKHMLGHLFNAEVDRRVEA